MRPSASAQSLGQLSEAPSEENWDWLRRKDRDDALPDIRLTIGDRDKGRVSASHSKHCIAIVPCMLNRYCTLSA